MMFIYETAKLAPVRTNILKIQVIFVHQTLTEHALFRSVALSSPTFIPFKMAAFLLLRDFLAMLIDFGHNYDISSY